MTTFLFVIGFILTIDLALGNVNIINLINGVTAEDDTRAGRSLLDDMFSVFPNVPTDIVMDELWNTVDQISQAVEKFENRNNPRSF